MSPADILHFPTKAPTNLKRWVGTTFVERTCCGKIFVTVCHDDEGNIANAFVRFGKAGTCGAAVMDGLFAILRDALAAGIEPEKVVHSLAGIGCHAGENTCMDAVARAFKKAIEGVPHEDLEVEPKEEAV